MNSDIREILRPVCIALMLILSGLGVWVWQDRYDAAHLQMAHQRNG